MRSNLRERKKRIKRRTLLKGRVVILTTARGRGASGLRKDAFEELNATIDAIVWSPELITES